MSEYLFAPGADPLYDSCLSVIINSSLFHSQNCLGLDKELYGEYMMVYVLSSSGTSTLSTSLTFPSRSAPHFIDFLELCTYF